MIIPEPGQIVRVRNQTFLVQDVYPYLTSEATFHKVALESLEDHRLGTSLEVIWELEVSPRVEDVISFPDLSAWDPPERLASLLLSFKWTEASVFTNDSFTAPFRGAIEIEPYQLEPVARALAMPRVSLLLADDVGLGKTVEAGLILQELLARGRVRKILILCPASLQRQWQDEMLTKFNLVFKIIDRDEIFKAPEGIRASCEPLGVLPAAYHLHGLFKTRALSPAVPEHHLLGSSYRGRGP